MNNINSKKWLKTISFIFLGALLGFGYYRFIGCTSGSCPITSNPWISTAYGAGIGALFVLGRGGQKKSDDTLSKKENRS